MSTEELTNTIKRELPGLLRSDPGLARYILELAREEFANRNQTEDRFDRLLNELRQDREDQARRWDEQTRKWDEQNKKWDEKWDEQNKKWDEQNKKLDEKWDEQNKKWYEQNKRLDEQNKKWDEQNKKWDGQSKKWDEQNKKWDEQNKKWDEQNKKWYEFQSQTREELLRVHDEIMAYAKKHERGIGALGSRWGIQTEAAFRNALVGILEESFDVQVVKFEDFDDEGTVFGHPDQIEIDVIVKNGLLIIIEIKSSISKAEMYTFERKARFYEKHHQRNAQRLMVISPMVDRHARKVAERLGIEVYSDSEDVEAI